MRTLMIRLKPISFVGYYKNKKKGIISTVIVDNIKNDPAAFTLILFRRERPKEGSIIIEIDQIPPGSTYTFWPPAFTLGVGDQLQVKSSKKEALVVRIGGLYDEPTEVKS